MALPQLGCANQPTRAETAADRVGISPVDDSRALIAFWGQPETRHCLVMARLCPKFALGPIKLIDRGSLFREGLIPGPPQGAAFRCARSDRVFGRDARGTLPFRWSPTVFG
jgi:hypothetical protein